MAVTTSGTLSLCKICQYLWVVDNAQKNAFFSGSIDNNLPILLYMERASLNYGSTQNLSTLSATTLYNYSLLGSKLQLANQILSNGSGGIIINPSGGGTSLTPYNINFIVSAGQAGVSTIQNSAWIGLQYVNQLIINQTVFQSGAQFTFNSLTGTFDLSLAGYILQQNDIGSGLGFK